MIVIDFFRGAVGRLIAVILFLLLSAFLWLYLFTGTAEDIPVLNPRGWTAEVYFEDADNLVQAGQVRIAGVEVGEVKDVVREGNRAKATFDVDPQAAPLHEGLTVRLGARSLVEDNSLEIVDGKGPELQDGAVIPAGSVQESTQVRDVLATLDDKTRTSAGKLLRSAGAATGGTQQEISATVQGLGALGRQGNSALDAIAAQSQDLEALSANLSTVLDSLNTGEGQIASLVTDAQRLTKATSDRQEAVADTVRRVPGVLKSATASTDSLNDLSGALAPVASDLKEAAPFLRTALTKLPDTTKDLRSLLPSLDGTLDKAPATLDRVPRFGDDVREIIPPTQALLSDVNPFVKYVAPYGNEIGTFLATFNAVLNYTDETGANYIRLSPVVQGTNSIQTPFPLPQVAGQYTNPFPKDEQGAQPGPFTGPYPRVERASR